VNASSRRRVAWLLNHYAQPPTRPGGTRHYELARHAADHGWDVHVIAASTELVTGEQTLAGLTRRSTTDESGVQFTWLRAPKYRGNGVARYLNMAAFAANAWVPGSLRHLPAPDVIIGSSVHPLTAAAAHRLARRHNVPFVFEVRDLWPETLVAFGALKAGSRAERAMARLVGDLYRAADRVITTMPGGRQCVSSYGVDSSRVEWIPNGVDLAYFPETSPSSSDDGLRVAYLGAHGRANGLDMVLDAMEEVRADPGGSGVRLVLVGDGPLKPMLRARVVGARLDGVVEFRDPVPHSDVADVMAEADALVFVAPDLPELYRFGMSTNKMSDYLASGRPIVAALNFPDDPVTLAGAGIVVAPTSEGLAQGILRLAAEPPDVRLAYGAAGRRYAVEHLDFALLGERLASILDDVVSGRSANAS
jgi:glycosyltransferase involved in cell wall biosynthesis